MWAIVVGDDRWPEWVPHGAFDLKAVPVQYCRLTALASPFQRAVHLAASIASASRVMVTALPEHRARWEPHTWFVRPSMRFLNEGNAVPRIALAAAISSVADRSPSNVLAIIPARSHVVHEFILREALARMVAKLPEVPEGVASLGMIDMDDSVDEDYLVLQRSSVGPGLNVSGIARRSRPPGWHDTFAARAQWSPRELLWVTQGHLPRICRSIGRAQRRSSRAYCREPPRQRESVSCPRRSALVYQVSCVTI